MRPSGGLGPIVVRRINEKRYAMAKPMTTTLLATGAALTVVGGIIGLACAAITTVDAGTAARRRIQQIEVPPSERARRQWRRARTAATAGAGAWRNGEVTPVG